MKWETRDLERDRPCHPEQVFKSMELDAVVILLDIRHEGRRESGVDTTTGIAHHTGFCNLTHEGHSEKFKGVPSIGVEIEILRWCFRLKPDATSTMGAP